jgi:antitoxin (DNA-binding transcriptional repressor) of toxin-antitoxin stability system
VKTLTVSEVARRFSSVLDEVERNREEIILVRNRRQIARLIPEPSAKTAREALDDICGKLDEETAESLVKAIGRARNGKNTRVDGLSDPWAS